VYRFNPVDARSEGLNPMDSIDVASPQGIAQAQARMEILAVPEGAAQAGEYDWGACAASFVTGLALHGRATGRARSLGAMDRLLSLPGRPVEYLFDEMLHSHPVAAQAAQIMIDTPERERGSVLSTARRYLRLFRDPVIAAITERSSVRYEALKGGAFPTTLYLCVSLQQRRRVQSLFRLIVTQLLQALTASLGGGKHQVLLLLDEFPALGQMKALEGAFAEIAGYGVRSLIAAQSLKQLWQHYGTHTPILDQCATRLLFAANDTATARYWSEMTGQATVLSTSHGEDRAFMQPIYQERRQTQSETGRPLMTAGEILHMRRGSGLLFQEGGYPARVTLTRYYRDNPWKRRACL
jgi:type IV secretion system protein VirD4